MILIVLLSSFSLTVLFVLNDLHSGKGDDLRARTESIYLIGTFTIVPSKAYVGTVLWFNVSARTTVGSSLNFTIYFDYLFANDTVNPASPVFFATTPTPGMVNTTHVYNAPGNYTSDTGDDQYVVKLAINDGTGVWRNLTREVTIVVNEAPVFDIRLLDVIDWEIGVPLSMSVLCSDEDNDSLTLTWDFGDGTDILENLTGPALNGVYCNRTHTWNPSPEDLYGISDYREYYIKLNLTDGQGNWRNTTSEIRLRVGHNTSPDGSLTTNATIIDPADKVWFLGKAWDPEGEPLTWTFVFNNSEGTFLIQVFHTPLTAPNTTVFMNASCSFPEAGMYNVSLRLSDIWDPELQNDPDRADHNKTVETVTVTSIVNRLPFIGTIRVEDWFTGLQDVVINETVGAAIAIFTLQVRDEDGEVLNATWDFGDSSESAYNLTEGGDGIIDLVQVHEYATFGQYNVSIDVTDGREGHLVSTYRLVNITANNSAPRVQGFALILGNGSYGAPGAVVEFILTLYDLECDPLTVSWDFGDGSPLEWTNVSSFAENGTVVCTITHVYAEVGDYETLINFTDGIVGIRGLHEGLWVVYVPIRYPYIPIVRYWDLWDYASLSLFILSVGLMVLWAVMGSIRRSRLDMMGTTMEEYVLRKQEIEDYEMRHRGGEEGSG